MTEWIQDHLPEGDRSVLVCTITKKGVKTIKTGYYTPKTGWVVGMNNNVIGWMELPDPPEWEESCLHTDL